MLREDRDAAPSAWAHRGSVSYGPGLNVLALLLAAYGNVSSERAAALIGMLTGVAVSPSWVDKASSRLNRKAHRTC